MDGIVSFITAAITLFVLCDANVILMFAKRCRVFNTLQITKNPRKINSFQKSKFAIHQSANTGKFWAEFTFL